MAYGFYPYYGSFFSYPFMLGYGMYSTFANMALMPLQFLQLMMTMIAFQYFMSFLRSWAPKLPNK